MLTPADFDLAAADLARLNGISHDQAAAHLAAIGDTPELAEDGRAVIRDADGVEMARVLLPLSDTDGD